MVTRLGEIAVRSALGASRQRILAQLFMESLVLTVVGAAARLGLARYALGVIQALNDADGGLPNGSSSTCRSGPTRSRWDWRYSPRSSWESCQG